MERRRFHSLSIRSQGEVVELLQDELQTHRVAVQLASTTRLPLVLGHRSQLQQVFPNIMTNAVEAMGRVTDRSRLLWIMSAESEPGSVLITIVDSGGGIAPGKLDRVFGASYTSKPDGMGMGLAICRSIMEFHGGRPWASPGDPHGTVFHIMLPVGGEPVVGP